MLFFFDSLGAIRQISSLESASSRVVTPTCAQCVIFPAFMSTHWALRRVRRSKSAPPVSQQNNIYRWALLTFILVALLPMPCLLAVYLSPLSLSKSQLCTRKWWMVIWTRFRPVCPRIAAILSRKCWRRTLTRDPQSMKFYNTSGSKNQSTTSKF